MVCLPCKELTLEHKVKIRNKLKHEPYVFCEVCNKQCNLVVLCLKRFILIESKGIPESEKMAVFVRKSIEYANK
jgi:hypothetical protein